MPLQHQLHGITIDPEVNIYFTIHIIILLYTQCSSKQNQHRWHGYQKSINKCIGL